MSSKGQIVIPLEMRKNLNEGDKILIIEGKDNLILKKANKIKQIFQEDLDFAKRTEEAWKRIESGDFISYSKEDFLNKLDKW